MDSKLNGSGLGNGVAMKISPVGAYASLSDQKYNEAIHFTMSLSQMTHGTSVSASTALAMMAAFAFCLKYEPNEFDESLFVNDITGAAELGKIVMPHTLEDDVCERLALLENRSQFDRERIISEWKGGCYCYNSIPFTFWFFLKDPMKLNSIFEVVNAGGDTDSNGSMLCGLLGALHGPEIFGDLPKQADQDQLKQILEVAESFANTFGFQ